MYNQSIYIYICKGEIGESYCLATADWASFMEERPFKLARNDMLVYLCMCQ